jgi:predicted RNase H-like nuclease (RuvC/YqgF family)
LANTWVGDLGEIYHGECKDYPNCHYKQLLATQKRLEELKQENEAFKKKLKETRKKYRYLKKELQDEISELASSRLTFKQGFEVQMAIAFKKTVEALDLKNKNADLQQKLDKAVEGLKGLVKHSEEWLCIRSCKENCSKDCTISKLKQQQQQQLEGNRWNL